MRTRLIPIALALVLLASIGAGAEIADPSLTAEQRMQKRYPQPVRVGDLIGLPVLDEGARTLGYVHKVVRTNENKIELIVDYDGFLGWGSRLVEVPLELVGIAGRHISSLDMPRAQYASAPSWHGAGVQDLLPDAVIRIALARH
jgi:hypothetical protein